MKTAPLAAVLALLMTLSAATFAQTPASAERYVDLTSTLQTEADFNTWYEGVYRLRQDFDEICGDTFCEGDYSNIQALRFVCSARAASGEIGQCVWSFAASDERIKPRAGHVRVAIPGFRCVSPLAPHTPR